jgi:hypothetical protein
VYFRHDVSNENGLSNQNRNDIVIVMLRGRKRCSFEMDAGASGVDEGGPLSSKSGQLLVGAGWVCFPD